MSRKPIIAANWKMQMPPGDTENFISSFKTLVNSDRLVDVVLAPPFVSLAKAAEMLNGMDEIALAAQNMHPEASGAYTGETSSVMLRELYVSYVILGHSERRALFGEDDAFINAKVKTAHEARIKPILCIGETLEEREGGKIEEVLRTQLTGSLKDIDARKMNDTVIAYEPVWAIGTGKVATPDQAQETHAFVRQVLTDLYDDSVASKVRIQYGGSVKPSNMGELISQPDVDGALVGGASLESGSFSEIIRGAEDYVRSLNA